MSARTLEERWIVRSHISWREKLNILYNGVETSLSIDILKTLKGSPEKIISTNPSLSYKQKLLRFEDKKATLEEMGLFGLVCITRMDLTTYMGFYTPSPS